MLSFTSSKLLSANQKGEHISLPVNSDDHLRPIHLGHIFGKDTDMK